MSATILIVDDEKEIADLIEVYLKNDGYTVYKFYNGREALKCIESQPLDLAILDVMLHDVDGFRICQKIREKYFYPVIMLTAKNEDMDKIMGLTIGADDYITKPFNANIFMFVPMGFITPVAFKEVRFFPKTILCVVAFSFCIEFIQYFIGRSADIDDLILNTLGGIIGYGIYALFSKCLGEKRFWRKLNGVEV